MKKISLLALSLLSMWATMPQMQAQKLSPGTEIMLEKQAHGVTPMRLKQRSVVADDAAAAGAIRAFVTINSPLAVGQMEELGVKVSSHVGDIVTAEIPVDLLREVGALPTVTYVSVGTGVNTLMDVARGHAGVNPVHQGQGGVSHSYTGTGVVVGVIDTGIEYVHPAFFSQDGSEYRIKAVWDQNTSRGDAPAGYNYGTELTSPQAIMAYSYDDAGQYHGCHTTNIAAGADMKSAYYGVAPDADIVFVSFKDDNTCIGDAIKYIFDYAESVGKPCVINMSLGSHTGPHNGTSELDRMIDSLTGPGRIVVGACGNEGEFRLHTSKTFTATDKTMKTMLTFHSAINHKYQYVDIWGSAGTNFKVKVGVVNSLKGQVLAQSAAFDTSDPSQQTVIPVFTLEGNGVDASGYLRGAVDPTNNQPHCSLELTVSDLAQGRMVCLIVEGEEGQQVDMWNFGQHEFSSNGKSGWSDGTYSGTVGEIGGTAHSIISVGSFDSRTTVPWLDGTYSRVDEAASFSQFHRSTFSSMGPTADGRISPCILGPGMPVISAINKVGFVNMGGSLERFTSAYTASALGNHYYAYEMGTSMSSPFVAGAVALMLQGKEDLTPDQAKELLRQGAVKASFMGELPNNDYGHGRIHVLNTIKAMETLASADRVGADPQADVHIWVDPVTSTLHVGGLGPDDQAAVTLYSASGVQVYSAALTGATIELPALGRGVYVARLSTDAQMYTSKITL